MPAENQVRNLSKSGFKEGGNMPDTDAISTADGNSDHHKSNVAVRKLEFYRELTHVLPARSVSDRTTFRRITQWIFEKAEKGKISEYEATRRVIDYAREANNPKSRVPAAVFVSLLKKELNYPD